MVKVGTGCLKGCEGEENGGCREIPSLKKNSKSTIPIENRSQINRTLIFIFQSNFDFKISIAIMILIENLNRINQTLVFIFQSNLD